MSIVPGLSAAVLLGACGGGGSSGNAQDSGVNKTTLTVQAGDPDGDALQYQWRVTAGTIDNRNANQTVWTMPDGPGLHFAYVVVSDGKGGYAEQQYAASTDAFGTSAPARAPVSRAAPGNASTAVSAGRLRFTAPDPNAGLLFAQPGGPRVQRTVYLPDVQVQIQSGGTTAFSGTTDLSGELSLPNLEPGPYAVKCSTVAGQPLSDCGSFTVGASAAVTALRISPPLAAARNLRLYGHVALADGGVCGVENAFFGLQAAATVQLLQSDGTAIAPPVRVNRFGDYAVDAAVLAQGRFRLKVACEGYDTTLDVPAAGNAGYDGTPLELSHSIPNARPAIARMVANGPDGNVRGRMIVAEAGTSTTLPGASQFLAYKGQDTPASACLYYQSIGAVGGCDAQGNFQDPITLDDWKRAHQFKPYDAGNAEVSAVYVNRMDLNLVRRMLATQKSRDDIAFVVCNHPGPDGSTQHEVDEALRVGLGDQNRVACVAMEWSISPGVNGGAPFTKFLTFGPGGALIPSINLDGRGEKYMPGACVACHGGTQYNGRFATQGTPSPNLGSGFLPFDTNNFLFGSAAGLSEAGQSQAIHDLNMLVKATDNRGYPSLSNLIDGWYANGGTTLDKQYVPPAWRTAEAAQPGAAGASVFYREVIGGVCRTCHAALGSTRFDWDANVSVVTNPNPNGITYQHFCGGTPDVALNASMPNALISRDRLADRIQADPTLPALMQKFLGCVTPNADPAYAKR